VSGPALFAAWRAEIEAELLETQQALADAHVSLREACAACEVAEAARHDLYDAVAGLRQPVSWALSARVRFADQDVGPAQGAVAQARGLIKACREKVADLEQALTEIAQLMPAPLLVVVEEFADADAV
jgi:hypothetical protein